MSDDLGRGMLGWPAARWTELDTIASDTVGASAVIRNLITISDQPDAKNVRIGAADVPVQPLRRDFVFNMQDEAPEDLERRLRIEAQELALLEDHEALDAMELFPGHDGEEHFLPSETLTSAEFIRAKNQLRTRGVQQGFGVVVSAQALGDLETEEKGVRSGVEFVEHIIGASIRQCNALGQDAYGRIHGVLFQASPAAIQMVRAYGPRLRVMDVNGPTIYLRLEEGIAARAVMPDRCLAIVLDPEEARRRREADAARAEAMH